MRDFFISDNACFSIQRGLRRPRLGYYLALSNGRAFSIHEAFADLDCVGRNGGNASSFFNPRGLRRPRRAMSAHIVSISIFQSTRPSQTSTNISSRRRIWEDFQSTRPSQTSTAVFVYSENGDYFSIHEAFADLD